MTQEEKLEMLKKSGITVLGDLVLEKHVENQFGNIEAGGIGILHQHGGSNGGRPKGNGNEERVKDTFTYRYMSDADSGLRIAKLHQYLVRAGWLEKNSSVNDFRDFFSGEQKDFTLKWMGSQQNLYYLIKVLCERKVVTYPKAIGQWVITGSHFLNKQSRPFKDWNKQKDPVKAKAAIERLADLLDVAKPLVD